MTLWTDSVVAITGASSGIGRAFALHVAARGARVAAFDRSAEGLDALRAELDDEDRLLAVAGDVTDADAATAFIEATVDRFGRLDILLNNAGITHIAPFDETPTERIERVLDVNVMGSIHTTRAAGPHLRASRGQVGVIGSVTSYSPLLYRTAYTASKHAVMGFFSSLRGEWAEHGIHVLIACPSFVRTDLQTHQQRYFTTSSEGALDPAHVARSLATGFERRRRLVLIGATARKAWWASRFFPRLYERIMLRRMTVSS